MFLVWLFVCGLFLCFFLLAKSGGWFVFFIVIFCITFVILFSVMIFVAIYHKSKHNEQLKNRRAIIRNYLRVENERYYHKRGLHWKPSRECSYLILKTSFKGENDENEIWLTGRNSLNIPTLIHQAKTFKSPRSDGGYP